MVVRLLETTYIRIGNEEYARSNGSYGLTTLTDGHVDIRGARIRFNFRGKSGKDHLVELNDKVLARLVNKSRDLPGEILFQYVDDGGQPHPIGSSDVNAYIRDIAGDEFTAKDFRTWAGTLLAARALTVASDAAGGVPLSKAAVARAVKETAGHLGNTPSVCRKCYIHPVIIEAFQDDDALAAWRSAARRKAKVADGLSAEEAALVRFLEAGNKIGKA
jgi:DNA topoisomerase-1